MSAPKTLSAFAGDERIVTGGFEDVARIVKTLTDAREPRSLLVFAYPTGEQVDLDLRGDLSEVLARVATPRAEEPEITPSPRRRGRPRLGVVGREVTLLPRHWEWLNAQPGGASVALRKLVEHARNSHRHRDRVRLAREAAYRFMSAIAGNEPGFEEASRALFASDPIAFADQTRNWAPDVREFAHRLATEAFVPDQSAP